MEEPEEPLINRDFRHYSKIIKEYYSVQDFSNGTMENINVHLVAFKSKVLQIVD